ncbi:MAG: signal peptide peptidase SppA [Anaerolineae bacterium]|nr:signal peptide peptidase SppA [Anaerolineae bacterium]
MNPIRLLYNVLLAIANFLYSLRRKGLDCIVLPIGGPYPELPPPRIRLPFPFNRLQFHPSATTLEDMRIVMEKIGSDPRVRTVVLRFDSLAAGPAALHSLRRMLLDLRDKDKRLVAWLPGADTWDYYLASACDEIILPPPGRLSMLGLRIEATFLKDALELVGVKADLESIGEYKTSADTFRRTTMTEPYREMMDAILDSYCDEIVAAIAKGRGLEPAQVRETIDRMPMLPDEALEAGLIDAVLYEDELPAHVRPPKKEGEKAAPLCAWNDVAHWLHDPIKRPTRQFVGVVSIQGMIVPGESRRTPIPLPLPIQTAQAGAKTITHMLRRAEVDKRIAAVILAIDSPGGSPLASDLICREVRRLRASKPVVVLMGEYAASGGYYIAALANRIVARPTTLTGSIGIWGGKFTLGGLYDKLGINRETLQRGAMAGIYSDVTPFSEAERAWIRRDMGETYAQFKALVAEGREMTEEQVEEIARGRVWSGAQAREIGLADELGDFDTALALAKELAGFKRSQDVPAAQIPLPRHLIMPQPFPVPGEAWTELLGILQSLARERVWAMAPWVIQVRV